MILSNKYNAPDTAGKDSLIGANLSEPHTNCYYEKIAIIMYVCVCVCVRDTSTTCFACTRTRINTFYIIYIHYVDHVFCMHVHAH